MGFFSLFQVSGVRHGLQILLKTPGIIAPDCMIEGNANPFSAAPPVPLLQPVLCWFGATNANISIGSGLIILSGNKNMLQLRSEQR